jgi:hypothetical protein
VRQERDVHLCAIAAVAITKLSRGAGTDSLVLSVGISKQSVDEDLVKLMKGILLFVCREPFDRWSDTEVYGYLGSTGTGRLSFGIQDLGAAWVSSCCLVCTSFLVKSFISPWHNNTCAPDWRVRHPMQEFTSKSYE